MTGTRARSAAVPPPRPRHTAPASAQQRPPGPASHPITTESGLRYVFLKHGSGPQPRPGDVMVSHGIGRYPDGREFWNTRTEGRPYEYRPRVDRVIRGFEEGMRYVREGDRVLIVMKPDLAYGERGNRDIPPNATLIFDYEILSIRQRPQLGPAEVDELARLLLLEDRRTLDDTALARLLRSTHPEVKRRAVLAVARIADPRGRALLAPVRADLDTAIAATVAWATGQLRDSAAVSWLAATLTSPETPRTVAREAAGALGKIRTPEAQAALAAYLATAPGTRAASATVGEALLAIGRFPARVDLAPVLRWTTSPDSTVRWRAAWALFRPRNPAATPHLLRLADDSAGEVRSWAVRGLTPALVDTAGIDREQTAGVLRAALADPDRRVRTEALRALSLYDDEASFQAVLKAMDDPDSWISVSAVEGLGRFTARADVVVPRLTAIAAQPQPSALRTTAIQSLRRLGVADSLIPNAPPRLARPAAQAGAAPGAAVSGTAPPAVQASARPPAVPGPPERPLADYRVLVERWVVPAYNYEPRPRASWETERGSIELELFAGEAPLAMEEFVRLVESGAIVGTEFGRVVPDFVAQMRTINGAALLRDEVNRYGLTRANLSWASNGLDTGRAGYTLGSTPQPHNEGDFTALGRVVRGIDVVDRLQLGDHITGVRMAGR
ncbi:MAG: hypothetical protein FIB01_07605 [Gemmatimonadetes bacterium]|nr:hypothetical protein [Gemmatimonadota bacterium]